jgi:hypothetical protein
MKMMGRHTHCTIIGFAGRDIDFRNQEERSQPVCDWKRIPDVNKERTYEE